MSDISTLTLSQAEEKMAARNAELSTIYEKAKQADGTYNPKLVPDLPDGAKSGTGFRDHLQQKNAEINELGEHIEALRDINQIADEIKARENEPAGRFVHPGASGDSGAKGGPANRGQFKSLGGQVIEAKGFKAWLGSGRAAPYEHQFKEALASDFLAKAAGFDSIGAKALMSTSTGFEPESIRMPGFVEAPTRPIQLLDILPVSRTGMPSVTYMEETTRTHGAAERAEGAQFAESEFAFTERTSPVRKITDSLPVTDEQLEDVAMVEGYINNRLPFGLRQRLDTQCAVGDGSAPNLRGLFNTTGTLTLARTADDNVIDVFYKSMVKVRLEGRAMATHHMIHPTDFQGIRLLKTSDGVYIYGSPTEAGPTRLWGLPVVEVEAQGVGKGMTGSFMPSYIELVERRGIDIQVGYIDKQFAEGKRTIRADMRAALPVYRPSAFCENTLTAP
ncbi:MAG: phage major capsid protein [Pseudomonadota bacterium]